MCVCVRGIRETGLASAFGQSFQVFPLATSTEETAAGRRRGFIDGLAQARVATARDSTAAHAWVES